MNVESSTALDPSFQVNAGRRERALHGRLTSLFLLSGVAALIYQVCWQRLLFKDFGVDIDSVTIIVSTFMLGLGVGALVGGELADRYPDSAPTLFALTELGIALFGLCSSRLIRTIAAATIQGTFPEIAAANFMLLLLPTTLMGATLPILVRHVVRIYRSVGVSVGILYFANTLGAALGAGTTGFVILYYLGLTSAIYLAGALNVAVSGTVWLTLRDRRV